MATDKEVQKNMVREPSNTASASASPAAHGWQDIETAPPYRVPVLLIAQYPTGRGWTDIYHGWRNAGGANWDRWPHNFRPTHWMLPPEPPADGQSLNGLAQDGSSPKKDLPFPSETKL